MWYFLQYPPHSETIFSHFTYWSFMSFKVKLPTIAVFIPRKWQPTPVFLPGESHGQRSLVGYSPQGRKESDTTEQLHFTHNLFGERFSGIYQNFKCAYILFDPEIPFLTTWHTVIPHTCRKIKAIYYKILETS